MLFGSLAHTGKGHLTDIAILSVLGEERTEVIFDRSPKTLPHPNTMTFFGLNEEGKELMERTYLSVGGGVIRAVGEEEGERKEVYPFHNFSEIKAYCEQEGIGLDEAAYRFEDGEFRDFLREVWDTMRSTVEQGLRETGELPGGLHVVRKAKTLSMRQPNESPEEREKREICSYAFADRGGERELRAHRHGAHLRGERRASRSPLSLAEKIQFVRKRRFSLRLPRRGWWVTSSSTMPP